MNETLSHKPEPLKLVKAPSSLPECSYVAEGTFVIKQGVLFVNNPISNKPSDSEKVRIPFSISKDIAEKVKKLTPEFQQEIERRDAIEDALSTYWNEHGKNPSTKTELQRLAKVGRRVFEKYLDEEQTPWSEIAGTSERRTIRKGIISRRAIKNLRENPYKKIEAVLEEYTDESGKFTISQKELTRQAGVNSDTLKNYLDMNGIIWNDQINYDARKRRVFSVRSRIEDVLDRHVDDQGQATATQILLAIRANANQQRIAAIMKERGIKPYSTRGRKRKYG